MFRFSIYLYVVPLAKTTSGQVVMLKTWAFQDWNILLSAKDENLGPSTVTIVPVSLTIFSRLAILAAWMITCLVFWTVEIEFTHFQMSEIRFRK